MVSRSPSATSGPSAASSTTAPSRGTTYQVAPYGEAARQVPGATCSQALAGNVPDELTAWQEAGGAKSGSRGPHRHPHNRPAPQRP